MRTNLRAMLPLMFVALTGCLVAGCGGGGGGIGDFFGGGGFLGFLGGGPDGDSASSSFTTSSDNTPPGDSSPPEITSTPLIATVHNTEPASAAIFGGGLLGLGLMRRRKRVPLTKQRRS